VTWSIVARDPSTGAFGVAVCSRVIAVGALCPAIRPGVGAVSSQSYTNPMAGRLALDALAAGLGPAAAASCALAADEGRAWRQLAVVDAAGRAHVHTGADCVEHKGHWTGDGVAVAGNMLTGPETIEAMRDAWLTGTDRAFDDRLLHALERGGAAGGDKRGTQSAALRVHGREVHAEVDLRVDEHPDPVAELRRILDMFRVERRPYYATLPSRRHPAGLFDPVAREAFIARYKDAVARGEAPPEIG